MEEYWNAMEKYYEIVYVSGMYQNTKYCKTPEEVKESVDELIKEGKLNVTVYKVTRERIVCN